MEYRIFQPPADLADLVEHLWAVENPAPLDRHREILIPNGRPTVLLCIGDPGLRIAEDGSETSNRSNVADAAIRVRAELSSA